MNKEPFSDIAGYEEEKSILKEIIGWYKNKKIVNNKSLTLPKGILLHGPCGTGKTAFAWAFAEALNVPCYTVDSEKEKTSEDVVATVGKAKENPLSVVFIDEIDLLLNNDVLAVRTLRKAMDEHDNIIFLATTNNFMDIDYALKRKGRFDCHIEIDFPTKEEAKEIFAFYLEQVRQDPDMVYSDDINGLLYSTTLSGADIKAVVNDALLRTDGKITKEALVTSFERIQYNYYYSPKKESRRIETAFHEAGHVVCLMEVEDYYTFKKAVFECKNGKGKTYFCPKSDRTQYLQESIFKNMVVGLGGYYAEKIVLSKLGASCKLSDGVCSDLETIRSLAAHLINIVGYDSPVDTLPREYERKESWISKIRNERKWRRLISKACREAKRAVKKHRKDIEEIATIMMEQGVFDQKDYKALRLRQK